MKITAAIILNLLIAISLVGQQEFIIDSEYLVEPNTIWVFTPENSNNEQPLPLIYLLHGWSGNYHQWDDIIDCQKYADKYNTIIVCPDGIYDSWYINSPAPNENDYATFFSWELTNTISQNFNVNGDSIFITGFSMGGHGALYLFELFTEYFQGAGSLSGLMDLRDWSEYYGLGRILGLSKSDDKETILSYYSVLDNADKLVNSGKKIIVSCGTEDFFYETNVKFVDFCEENQVDVEFISTKGDHNVAYWRSAVVKHFDFFLNK